MHAMHYYEFHIVKLLAYVSVPLGFIPLMDPCKGPGAFFNRLPAGALWCEISHGRDFFDYQDKTDWLISNPPYSTFGPWLTHSLAIADHICYLLPTNKIFASMAKMRQIRAFGGIKHMRTYGSGRECGFPFGFAVAAIYMQRGYQGPIEQSYYDEGKTL